MGAEVLYAPLLSFLMGAVGSRLLVVSPARVAASFRTTHTSLKRLVAAQVLAFGRLEVLIIGLVLRLWANDTVPLYPKRARLRFGGSAQDVLVAVASSTPVVGAEHGGGITPAPTEAVRPYVDDGRPLSPVTSEAGVALTAAMTAIVFTRGVLTPTAKPDAPVVRRRIISTAAICGLITAYDVTRTPLSAGQREVDEPMAHARGKP